MTAPGRRGTLFLVVGPSGAGKDSIIGGARDALRMDRAFVFPRRVITRTTDDGGEDHVAATPDEFDRQAADGAFALHWRANGHAYGIPRAVEDDLACGRHVVANVSRTAVDDARARLGPVRVVQVDVPVRELARRLALRGRESEDEIQERLERARRLRIVGEDVVEFENAGSLSEAIARFVDMLTEQASRRTGTAA